MSFFHSLCPFLCFLCNRTLVIKALLLTVKQTLPELLSKYWKCEIPDVVLLCIGALNILLFVPEKLIKYKKAVFFISLLFITFGGEGSFVIFQNRIFQVLHCFFKVQYFLKLENIIKVTEKLFKELILFINIFIRKLEKLKNMLATEHIACHLRNSPPESRN